MGTPSGEVAVACESATAARENNQDRCCAEAMEARGNLWGFRAAVAVADGMGGHEQGEVAAQIAIDTILEVVRARPEDHEQFDTEFLGADSQGVLARAFALANRRIHERAEAENLAGNTGTTLTVVAVSEEGAVVGHVGDSKAFIISGERIEKVTEEHSWVGERVREGLMTEEEAARSPLRSHLTQAVGCGDTVEPYLRSLSLAPGDVLVLCSDGLTEVVTLAGIAEVVRSGQPPEEACRALVEAALTGGARDNVTVAVLALREQEGEGAPAGTASDAVPASPDGEGPPDLPGEEGGDPPADQTVAVPPVTIDDEATPGHPADAGDDCPVDAKSVGAFAPNRILVLGAVCFVALLAGLLVGKAIFRARTSEAATSAAPSSADAPTPPTTAGAGSQTPSPSPTGSVFRLEVTCQGSELVLMASEGATFTVYPQGEQVRLLATDSSSNRYLRFRLLKAPPAAWAREKVALEVRRLGKGRIGIQPTPADLDVFVDREVHSGSTLESIKPQGARVRVGFYFPPDGGPGSYGIAVTDLAVALPAAGTEAASGAR